MIFCAVALTMVGVSGCGDDNEKGLAWSKSSGCKTEAMTRSDDANPWGTESVEYEARSGGQLYLKHVNALFSCDTERVEVSAKIEGSKISIIEQPVGNDEVNCLCPQDVECCLNGLETGTYTVTYYFRTESNPLFSFSVKYDSTLKGSYYISPTTENKIKYGNQLGTIENATGTMFYDSSMNSWYIRQDLNTEGNIDTEVIYYPIELSNEYKKKELKVTFSGTLYKPEFNIPLTGGLTYYVISLSMIK